MLEGFKPEVYNMQETVAKAKEMGINISLYALRKLIDRNIIPHNRIDRTVLIPWDAFLAWALCCERGDINPTFRRAGAVT